MFKLFSPTHLVAFAVASSAFTGVASQAIIEDSADDGSRSCPLSNRGYYQVNTVLTDAFNQILTDGQYGRIETYNAGFPGGFVNPNAADPKDCTRSPWDRSEVPQGILAEAVRTGVFKWCMHPAFYGDASVGLIGVAESDVPLQNVKAGDHYGVIVDLINALTSRMSLTLHASLTPEFVVVDTPGVGFFEAFSGALANDECYATIDIFIRHPYREATAIFTCPTTTAAAAFQLFALDTYDLSNAIADQGEGISICTSIGSTQLALVERTFPLANVVLMDSIVDQVDAVCNGVCDAFVSLPDTAFQLTESSASCTGKPLGEPVPLPPVSSGGDGGAITHRPKCYA